MNAYTDIVVHNQASTIQYLHYLLTLGLLVWATSMFASYAIFGHHRPLNAVVVVGLLLVGDMALTINDQLFYLVVYSLAALFLLIRGHVIEEQSEWLRRRIGDPASISSVYLRGGTAFVSIAVIGALVLTQTAASAPLAGAWAGMKDGLTTAVERGVAVPAGGRRQSVVRRHVRSRTPRSSRSGRPTASLALTIQLSPGDDADYYWRAVTYDRIDLNGWSMSNTSTRRPGRRRRAADRLRRQRRPGRAQAADLQRDPGRLPRLDDPVAGDAGQGRRGHAADRRRAGRLLRDRRSRRRERPVHGDGAGPGRGQRPGPAQRGAAARRRAPTTRPRSGACTSASPTGSSGRSPASWRPGSRPNPRRTRPYDLAATIVKELHSSAFTYDTDVRGHQLRGDLDRRVLRRSSSAASASTTRRRWRCSSATWASRRGSPRGSCPARATGRPGQERIFNSNAHAWVEVYFPGYRLGDVRPDRRRARPARAAPVGQAAAVRRASPPAAPRC